MGVRRARTWRGIAGLTALGAGLAGMLAAGAVGTASAAEASGTAFPNAIDPASISVMRSGGAGAPSVGDRVRIDANWSVPDSAVAGDSFGMTLPEEFARYTASFALPDAETGEPVAQCTVGSAAAPEVVCTLTDFVTDRTGVSGALWFQAAVDGETTGTAVDFTLDGELVTVELPGPIGPQPGTGTQPPALPELASKASWVTADGTMSWRITVPGAMLVGIDPVAVDDVLAPAGDGASAHENRDGRITVRSVDADRGREPVAWAGPGWNAAGTGFSIELPAIGADRFYEITYSTIAVVPVDGSVYRNTANVSGAGELTDDQTWTASGGGTGGGVGQGRVELRKSVTGEASDLIGDEVFTVRYSYGDPALSQTLELSADGSATGIALPAGTVVTLEELTPPVVDGVDWGAPVFSGGGVVDLGDGRATVTIDAGRSLQVTLTNIAAAAAVPPPIAEPPAQRSAPAPIPVPAGTLAATGDATSLPLLSAGAVVLLLGVALVTAARVRPRADRVSDRAE